MNVNYSSGSWSAPQKDILSLPPYGQMKFVFSGDGNLERAFDYRGSLPIRGGNLDLDGANLQVYSAGHSQKNKDGYLLRFRSAIISGIDQARAKYLKTQAATLAADMRQKFGYETIDLNSLSTDTSLKTVNERLAKMESKGGNLALLLNLLEVKDGLSSMDALIALGFSCSAILLGDSRVIREVWSSCNKTEDVPRDVAQLIKPNTVVLGISKSRAAAIEADAAIIRVDGSTPAPRLTQCISQEIYEMSKDIHPETVKLGEFLTKNRENVVCTYYV